MIYGGVRVFSTPHAMVRTPAREHTKTRSMSDAYHKRVQKKWDKRYGVDWNPGMYQISNGDIYAHPIIYEQLRNM